MKGDKQTGGLGNLRSGVEQRDFHKGQMFYMFPLALSKELGLTG